jgi:hypothetical protein
LGRDGAKEGVTDGRVTTGMVEKGVEVSANDFLFGDESDDEAANKFEAVGLRIFTEKGGKKDEVRCREGEFPLYLRKFQPWIHSNIDLTRMELSHRVKMIKKNFLCFFGSGSGELESGREGGGNAGALGFEGGEEGLETEKGERDAVALHEDTGPNGVGIAGEVGCGEFEKFVGRDVTAERANGKDGIVSVLTVVIEETRKG